MYEIPEIDVHQLRTMMLEKENFLLIDVREHDEYATANIKGSILIPLNTIPDSLSSIPRDVPLVLHCKAGIRSARACAYLMKSGYSTLHNLAGGMDAWLDASYPHDSLHS